MTTIITKNGSGAPTAGQLSEGELAVDLTNKELYTKSGTTVIKIGAQGGSSGTFTDLTATSSFTSPGIDDNATSTALTVTDSGIAATLTTAAQPNVTSVGTLTGFASTGIDDNATSTAITIGSDEDVTFAGGVKLDGKNASIGLKLDMAGSDDYVIKESSSNDIMQYGGGAASAFYHSISSGSLRLGTAGGGISFNGDTAAANALDDYEEGTWTVTLTNRSGSAPTASLGNATGYYVKVGKMVHATWYSNAMTISAIGGTSAQISGLPFTIENLNNHYPVATFTHATCFGTQIQNGFGFLNTANFSPNVEGGTANPNWVTGSSLYLACSIVYRAA